MLNKEVTIAFRYLYYTFIINQLLHIYNNENKFTDTIFFIF